MVDETAEDEMRRNSYGRRVRLTASMYASSRFVGSWSDFVAPAEHKTKPTSSAAEQGQEMTNRKVG